MMSREGKWDVWRGHGPFLEQPIFQSVRHFQDSLSGLRLRTEQVISENEMLYKRLKESSTFPDAPEGNKSTVKVHN